MSAPIVVGITGASGVIYATRLLEVLLTEGHDVHLAISPSGATVLRQELRRDVDLDAFTVESLLEVTATKGRLSYHRFDDYFALHRQRIVFDSRHGGLPLFREHVERAIARAGGGNLIQRAAEVHLKERRKLILVPRETPLSLPQIENMRLATEAGAVLLPATPGWYHGVRGVSDLVDFIVGRILDQLGISTRLMRRWGEGAD